MGKHVKAAKPRRGAKRPKVETAADDLDFEGADSDVQESAVDIGGTARGRNVTMSELALLTGWTPAQIRVFLREGMPIEQPGGPGKAMVLNTWRCIRWILAREVMKAEGNGTQLDEAKLRQAESDAQLRELKVAALQGTLIEVSEVRSWLEKKFGDFRSRVLAIESQVPSLAPEQRADLQEAVHDALTELSGSPTDGREHGTATPDSDDDDASDFG